MRKDQESGLPANWKELIDVREVAKLIEQSNHKPIGIFKHSIRCGISTMIKYQLEENWDLDPADIDFYYLDLITHRPTSNEVSAQTGVTHQSPQVIILDKGQVIHHSSHHAISVGRIREALEN